MTCAISMVFLNTTLLPIALPTIERQLLVTPVTLQWIINSYLLATAVFVIAGGRLGDLFGHRRFFCMGMIVYACASISGGLAQTGWWLILSRGIQGMGGAMMSPAAMSILIHAFPLKQRGKAIGIMVAIASLFLSIGPFIGGLFTELFSWRWSFWCNLPIATLGIILTMKSVPKSKKLDEKFDFIGFITTSIGLFCLTLALMQGKSWGWSSPIILALFFFAVVFILAARFLDRFAQEPFFDFNLFKNPIFISGTTLIFCSQFVLMITVFWPIFFQKVLGFSPIDAGLYTALATIPLIIVAPLSGTINDHFGPRLPIVIGFSLAIFCFLWFFLFSRSHDIHLLVPALLAFGSGIAFVMTPASTTTLGSVPKNKTGVATGMYNMIRFTGATIGVAILGALQYNIQQDAFGKFLKANRLTNKLDPSLYDGYLADLPTSVEAMEKLTPPIANLVKSSLYEATALAFSWTNLLAGAVAMVALIVGAVFFKSAARK
ncbi:DHA2 family efflux MFS transporter permease subunit [Simkania sp.]|uniref:MFS transporter n=1 Tax=Simkania sp. TaxID=34094 RepID=UPI003B52775B